MAKRKRAWQAGSVRALRQHLGLTQAQLAAELGTRQATISEWEHGLYAPRGASARLLTLVAEQAGFYLAEAGAEQAAGAEPERRAEETP